MHFPSLFTLPPSSISSIFSKPLPKLLFRVSWCCCQLPACCLRGHSFLKDNTKYSTSWTNRAQLRISGLFGFCCWPSLPTSHQLLLHQHTVCQQWPARPAQVQTLLKSQDSSISCHHKYHLLLHLGTGFPFWSMDMHRWNELINNTYGFIIVLTFSVHVYLVLRWYISSIRFVWLVIVCISSV